MLQDMLPRHLVTLFLIILLSILLRSQKSFRDSELRYFWLTVLSCLLLMFEDALEIIASEDPSLRFWRILLSVLGYTFRSTAALGLLLVVVSAGKADVPVVDPRPDHAAGQRHGFFHGHRLHLR